LTTYTVLIFPIYSSVSIQQSLLLFLLLLLLLLLSLFPPLFFLAPFATLLFFESERRV
jgi:hypothetical protein